MSAKTVQDVLREAADLILRGHCRGPYAVDAAGDSWS